MKLTRFVAPALFLTLALLASCLSDPIEGPEVRSSQVHGPTHLFAYSTNFQAPDHADMIVHWGHTITDTQLNFSGYYVRLYTSHQDTATQTDTGLAFVKGFLVPKIGNKVDTIVTIPNLPQGRYTIKVNGQQTADTLTLSSDTSTYSFYLDARPLENPTNLTATSSSSGSVTLRWTLPATDIYGSMSKYVIYYRDSDLSNGQKIDTGMALPVLVTPGMNTMTVPLPAIPNANDPHPQIEHKYQMWVKSVRSDGQEFYNDSSMIVWSGAERVRHDSMTHSIFFSGASTTGFTLIDDSVDAAAQITFDLSGGNIKLTAQHGGSFLNKIDRSNSLDSLFYKYPYLTNFDQSTITIPNLSSIGSGGVVYFRFPDAVLTNKYDYARVLFTADSAGNITRNNAINVEASWQHATNKSGTDILPYY